MDSTIKESLKRDLIKLKIFYVGLKEEDYLTHQIKDYSFYRKKLEAIDEVLQLIETDEIKNRGRIKEVLTEISLFHKQFIRGAFDEKLVDNIDLYLGDLERRPGK